jgi:hypothetical protein
MKIILASLVSIFSVMGFSQTVVDVGKTTSSGQPSNLFYAVGGVPINNAKYVSIVEGTPFLNELFSKGKIILSGGKIYSDIKLRLDLMENTLQYISPEGEELIATTPIKTVFVTDDATSTEKQFDYADQIISVNKVETGWYQLLDSGALKLYKRHFKVIRENKPYGSATTEKYITTSYSYYILHNAAFTPVKKFKNLPDMLQDKKSELIEYIKSKNLTGISDKDYMVLVSYYNSFKTKK